ncbi:hypothetical protein ACWKYF_05490 [Enterobacter asburiae]
MRAIVLLICLMVAVPTVRAADWLAWRKVGDATLTWGPFTVYTSQLRTPDGRYRAEEPDLVFVLNDKQGQFWYRATATQRTFIPLGPRQSEAFSSRFLAIWLDPPTQYPELRQQLIGGQK